MAAREEDGGVLASAVGASQLLEDEGVRSARLVARFQGGDLAAYTLLYDQYAARVLRYLRFVLHNPYDAEDVSQHVFLKVFEALPAYRVGEQPFWNWLSRIVRRAALDHLEKHARTEPTAPDLIDRRRDDVGLLGWGSHADIHVLITELPHAQQQVLALLYRYEFSAAQAAEALGRTPESIRQLRHRALARLELMLAERALAPAKK